MVINLKHSNKRGNVLFSFMSVTATNLPKKEVKMKDRTRHNTEQHNNDFHLYIINSQTKDLKPPNY